MAEVQKNNINRENAPQTQNQNQTAMQNPAQQQGQPWQGGSRALEPRRDWNQSRYSPFTSMQRFMNEMDRLFGDFTGLSETRGNDLAFSTGWAPEVDIFQRGNELVFHADLAGIKQEDVKVNVDDGVLTIAGERRNEYERDKNGVYQTERSYGSFQRAFRLPDGVDASSIHAHYENGVLEVAMPTPRQTTTKGRDIPIGQKPQTKASVNH